MSKKKKSKKSKKDVKSPESSKKSKKTSKKSGYKRGSLSKAIYEHFDKVGVDEAKYEDCLKLAKEVKKDTKFDKYHMSWYKNKYRQLDE